MTVAAASAACQSFPRRYMRHKRHRRMEGDDSVRRPSPLISDWVGFWRHQCWLHPLVLLVPTAEREGVWVGREARGGGVGWEVGVRLMPAWALTPL